MKCYKGHISREHGTRSNDGLAFIAYWHCVIFWYGVRVTSITNGRGEQKCFNWSSCIDLHGCIWPWTTCTNQFDVMNLLELAT